MKTSLRSFARCLVTQILNQKLSEWNHTPTESQQNSQSSELKIVILFFTTSGILLHGWVSGCLNYLKVRNGQVAPSLTWTRDPFPCTGRMPLCKENTACWKYSLNDMQHMWVTAPRRSWVTPGQEPAKNTGPHESRKNGGGHVDAQTITLGSDSRRTALRSLACDSRILRASFMT